MLDDVGADMDALAKAVLTKRLAQRGVKIHTGTKIVRFTDSTAIALRGDSEMALPFDTVVMAMGMRSDRLLADALASIEEHR